MISAVFGPIMLHLDKFRQVIWFPVIRLMGSVVAYVGHSFTLVRIPTGVFRRFVDISRESAFYTKDIRKMDQTRKGRLEVMYFDSR